MTEKFINYPETLEGSTERGKGKGRGRERLLSLQQKGEYVFHGSPEMIDSLTPKQAYKENMEEDGKPAVCASPYADIAIFRALVNSRGINENEISTSRFGVSGDDLHFSTTENLFETAKEKVAYVYVFKKDLFEDFNEMECRCYEEIKPLEVVKVTFDDLPDNIGSIEGGDYEKSLGIIEKRIDDFLDKLIEESNNNSEVIDKITSELREEKGYHYVLFKEETDTVITSIEELKSKIFDEGELQKEIKTILDPLVKLIAERYKEIEEEEVKRFNRQGNFKEINRVLSYGGSHDIIHLHHPPARTIPKEERVMLYVDGFKKLAEIVKERPHVKIITASGSLAFKMKDVLSDAGFSIEEMSEELRSTHFEKEKREVVTATITREDFLERYLVE